MRIDAHPLVIAAALGLLGPAALAEDEPEGLGGTWDRGESEGECEGNRPCAESGLDLGQTLEIIPVEDRLLIEGPHGEDAWSRVGEDQAQLVVSMGDTRVSRSLRLNGESLVVRTVVERSGERHEFRATYHRSEV
jgi:hypothetical protein